MGVGGQFEWMTIMEHLGSKQFCFYVLLGGIKLEGMALIEYNGEREKELSIKSHMDLVTF